MKMNKKITIHTLTLLQENQNNTIEIGVLDKKVYQEKFCSLNNENFIIIVFLYFLLLKHD